MRRMRAGAGAVPGLAALALAAALAACGGGTGGDGGAESSAVAAQPGSGRVVNVEVRTLSPGAFTETIRVTGVAEANRDVTLAAEESGTIRALPVEKGTPVSANEVVARIDDAILTAEVGQAEARASLARERYERQRQLFEERNAVSEISFLEARYNAEEAAERLTSLRERLARTRVRVPFAGVLEDRLVELGSSVAPGTAVARLVDLDPIRVSGGVPERYARDVEVGTEATVRFDVLSDTAFSARLAYVGATVDRESRTFPVEFTIRNPGRVIKPEMVANVELVRRRWTDAIVVPRDAVVRREEGHAAFVVEERDGEPVARDRVVALGPARDDLVVVRSGLEPGDRLVVVGQGQVARGDRVRIVGEDRGAVAPAAGGS